MADITMCNGDIVAEGTGTTIGCPYKSRCHRCLAYASQFQSYFASTPYKDGYCEHFWDELRYKMNLTAKTTIEEFIDKVKRNVSFRNERAGQAVFNAAYDIAPTDANKYRNGSVDPFYNDALIVKFIQNFFKLGEKA
jgi:hypothetical protein